MSDHLKALFPNLRESQFHVTSPASYDYNCIAWAAEVEDDWWWPDPYGDYYWPTNVPRDETVEAFHQCFMMFGYHECGDARHEPGIEKVAVYVDQSGRPTHAARQLTSGKWTSKLGQLEDIEHDLPETLEGDAYGRVGFIACRPVHRYSED